MLRWGVLISFLFVAAFFDIYKRKISNAFLVFMAVIGFALFLYTKEISCLSFLLSTIGMLIVLFPLYLIHGMGAGDIKLLCVCGVYIGVAVYAVLMIALFVGAIIGGLRLLIHRRFLSGLWRSISYFLGIWDGRIRSAYDVHYSNVVIEMIPFAVCITIGALIYWCWILNGGEVILW